MQRWHVEYAVGGRLFLSTRNLSLQKPREFRDKYIGPFRVIERIGNTSYHLGLAGHRALCGVHNVFHVSLLSDW